MSEDKFFSKPSMNNFLWGILLMFSGWIGHVVYTSYTGPEEVRVVNEKGTRDTTISIIQFQPDERYFENLVELTSRNVIRSYPKSNSVERRIDLDSIANEIAKDFQLKFDSLQIVSNPINFSRPEVKSVLSPVISVNNNALNMSVKRPKFNLPAIVSGYTQGLMNSYISVSLESKEMSRKENVKIDIDVLDKSVLSKMTPLFVSITKKTGENSYYHIWGEQYELKSQKSVLTFSADLKPGNYELTVGFYLLSEINTTYPPFYHKTYIIIIS